jgi:hypothetical protein
MGVVPLSELSSQVKDETLEVPEAVLVGGRQFRHLGQRRVADFSGMQVRDILASGTNASPDTLVAGGLRTAALEPAKQLNVVRGEVNGEVRPYGLTSCPDRCCRKT